jgi:hypothetical protein
MSTSQCVLLRNILRYEGKWQASCRFRFACSKKPPVHIWQEVGLAAGPLGRNRFCWLTEINILALLAMLPEHPGHPVHSINLIWNSFIDACKSSTEWATSRCAPTVDSWVYSESPCTSWTVYLDAYFCGLRKTVMVQQDWPLLFPPTSFPIHCFYNNPDIVRSTLRNFRSWHNTVKWRNYCMLQEIPLNVRCNTYVEEIKLSL